MRLLPACLLVTAVIAVVGCAQPMSRGGGSCGPMGCSAGCPTCTSPAPAPACTSCGGNCAPDRCVQFVREPLLQNKRMYGRTAPTSREGYCPCQMCQGRGHDGRGHGCAHCGGKGFGPCGLFGKHHDLAYRKEAPPYGPQTPAVAYPYYTTRGPRDFLVDNPPGIGPN